MKPTFLKYERPLLCAMILCSTPDECIEKIKKSLDAGAEAFGIQLCKLKQEYRSVETLKRIFDACEGKPIYVTSYRGGESKGFSDDECVELLMRALDAGATLFDLMGDMFGHPALNELTLDTEAVAKQKAVIDEIHRRGGEVLISCHTGRSTTLEENLAIAKAYEERGADVIKIVNVANSPDEIPKYIEAIQKIVASTDRKLLFLVSKAGKLIRYIGADLGVCMYLCLESVGQFDNPDQPLIGQAKAVRDNIRV